VEQVISDTLKFGIGLISILNPIGVIPVFLSLTSRYSNHKIKLVARSCSITVAVTILISLFLGQKILGFFGISIASFTIGGGFLIFSMAFSMIRAQQTQAKMNQDEIDDAEETAEIGIVPLAIPLLSGPGTISTSIIQAKHFNDITHWIGAVVIIFVVALIVYFILRNSRAIGDRLGKIGLNVMTRVMGLILLSISIEMIVSGVKEILPILKG